MACFLVPTAEAIVVSIIKKKVETKEQLSRREQMQYNKPGFPQAEQNSAQMSSAPTILWSRKLKWLSNLLWGGVLLLGVEHIWHGEVVPWPPFLTAMANPADMLEMFQEMMLVGSVMCAVITGVWLFMTWFAQHKACGKSKANRSHSKTRKAAI